MIEVDVSTIIAMFPEDSRKEIIKQLNEIKEPTDEVTK